MHPELSALVSIFLYLFFLFTIVYLIIVKSSSRSKKRKFDRISLYLLILGGILILFSILSPAIIFGFFDLKKTAPNVSESLYAQTGPLGDTLGGVMNPFIAIAGVIITGLAFYAQYNANLAFLEANEDLKKQFKLQQFESQFYEMLSLHKENVNEMSIDDESFNLNEGFPEQSEDRKEIKGRKIFYLMVKEFHALYNIIKYVCIKINPSDLDDKLNFIDRVKIEYFKLAYNIFFSGKEILKIQIDLNQLDHLNIQRKSDFFIALIKELEKLRKCHKRGLRYLNNYIKKNDTPKSLHIDFSYKPFSGHQIRLAHFYRHMHSIANFVINQNNDILNYEEKRKYLKMFRAQLSNHEIALLYYNWIGGHGEAWEDEINKFFTDFRMLHNINSHLVLSEFDIETFFDQDIYRKFKYKAGKQKQDLLFELYGIVSQNPESENSTLIKK